jgi:hypothetical protein
MNKTISIHPDLFKTSSSRTARKRPAPTTNNDIKVRPQLKEKHRSQSLRRNHVLRFIREQQEKNYKTLLADNTPARKDDENTGGFDSDFDNSLKYLKTLDRTNGGVPITNQHHTLRNRVALNENVSLDFPTDVFNREYNIPAPLIEQSTIQLAQPKAPSWGCLKNGSLPTFRSWKNVTQRVVPTSNSHTTGIFESVAPYGNNIEADTSSMPRIHEIREMSKQVVNKPTPRMSYPKQKRTVCRTYKVGRCKTKPVVGVLISNRTIRNLTTTKTQLMKQTPIEDVRRCLVKRGFIKVGSIAPNDVLRKMYETALLMCGEIDNHNPDNLLYNYFHDANNESNN